jgi:hypothetical protein
VAEEHDSRPWVRAHGSVSASSHRASNSRATYPHE